jgi:RimJ/RimL family protein N-acetyltransferase
MFARTERLLLRPGFIEDAPELTAAVADEGIARNLARLPWPYNVEHARDWLSIEAAQPLLPNMLITLRTGEGPRIIGGIGIHLTPDVFGVERPEIGYWVARRYWGLGFATEAGRAVLAIARTNGLPPLMSGHFVDNPASGKVLRKLGFRPTGQIAPRFSVARGEDVACALYEEGDGEGDVQPMTGKRDRVSCSEDFREELRLRAA